MLHEAASDNVFTEFTTYAGLGYWSIVLGFIMTCLSPFLYTGQTLACSQSDGIEPEVRDFSNMIAKMGAILVLHSLRTLQFITSGPLALWGLMFFRGFSTPLTWILMLFICG